MTGTLFPEMAQSTFQPLLARLRENEQGRGFSADEVHELVTACEFGAAVLEKLWEMFQGILHEGLEGRKMLFLVKEFADIIEQITDSVFPRVSGIVASQAFCSEEKQTALRTLDGFAERAGVMRKELDTLREWLETPPSPVDLSTILAGLRESKYEDIDDVLANLSDRLCSCP